MLILLPGALDATSAPRAKSRTILKAHKIFAVFVLLSASSAVALGQNETVNGNLTVTGNLEVQNNSGSRMYSLALRRSGSGGRPDLYDLNGSELVLGGSSSSVNQLVLKGNGDFGIGTASPQGKFHLKLPPIVQADNSPSVNDVIIESFRGNGVDPSWYDDTGGGIRLFLAHDTNADRGAFIKSVSESSYSRHVGLAFGTSYDYEEVRSAMYLSGIGNLGIGTDVPSHKLEVNGTIRAKEVVVESGWADFVFEDDYHLPSLEDIEKSIQEKRRLPGVPSAEEARSEGLSLGESQKIMMQKIEELTLYLIQKDKQIRRLENEIAALKKNEGK